MTRKEWIILGGLNLVVDKTMLLESKLCDMFGKSVDGSRLMLVAV